MSSFPYQIALLTCVLTNVGINKKDANLLLHIYAVHTWPDTANPPSSGEIDRGYPKPYHTRSSTIFSRTNALRPNGHTHARTSSEAQRINDAEAFELQGLISDEENEAAGTANGPMGTIEEEHPVAAKEESQDGAK